tara:strand:+ start:10078 stop:10356 length:279 start_codon:yes stop_codon:yes gene_type:complete
MIKLADWQADGLRLFGDDPNQWEFVCPACKLVQKPADFLALGMPQKMVDTLSAFSCIRRWADQGCMFAGQGPIMVHITDQEPPRPTFDWNQS